MMQQIINNQFQRYNQVFRIIIIVSSVVSLMDCLFLLIFPDVEIEIMTEEGFDIISIDDMLSGHVLIFALSFALTPLLWLGALWQLWGISRIWQKGDFLTREIGQYFRRFSFVIIAIFIVETILSLGFDYLLYSWNYTVEVPEIYFEDVLLVVEWPFLVACIFLIMGVKAMSEIISIKEESDLTI